MDNRITLSALIGFITAWWGKQWILILLVAVALMFDFATGVFAAGYQGGLSKNKLYKGVYKKIAYVLLMCLGFFIDVFIEYIAVQGMSFELPFAMPFGIIVAAWIVIGEMLSIVENLSKTDVKIPVFLKKWLEKAQGELDEE